MCVTNTNSHDFLIKLTPRIGHYWASTRSPKLDKSSCWSENHFESYLPVVSWFIEKIFIYEFKWVGFHTFALVPYSSTGLFSYLLISGCWDLEQFIEQYSLIHRSAIHLEILLKEIFENMAKLPKIILSKNSTFVILTRAVNVFNLSYYK